MILSITFFALAAICNAVMDVLSFRFTQSIFKHEPFTSWLWNPEISWKNKYEDKDPNKPMLKLLGLFDRPFTDAWHTLKSLMIVFIILSIVTFNIEVSILSVIFGLIVYGTIWNVVFNLFYNHLLIKK